MQLNGKLQCWDMEKWGKKRCCSFATQFFEFVHEFTEERLCNAQSTLFRVNVDVGVESERRKEKVEKIWSWHFWLAVLKFTEHSDELSTNNQRMEKRSKQKRNHEKIHGVIRTFSVLACHRHVLLVLPFFHARTQHTVPSIIQDSTLWISNFSQTLLMSICSVSVSSSRIFPCSAAPPPLTLSYTLGNKRDNEKFASERKWNPCNMNFLERLQRKGLREEEKSVVRKNLVCAIVRIKCKFQLIMWLWASSHAAMERWRILIAAAKEIASGDLRDQLKNFILAGMLILCYFHHQQQTEFPFFNSSARSLKCRKKWDRRGRN